MWPKLHKQVAVDREQLNHLLESLRPLLITCKDSPPNAVELSALAAMLHAFYTGVENVFKRITVLIDNEMPHGESSHRELLAAMGKPGKIRQAVISKELHDRLRGYLDFRHVFRQAYTFQLRWQKMAPLVLECEQTLRQIEQELEFFFASHGTDQT